MSWEDAVQDDWENAVDNDRVAENWEDETAMLFDPNTTIDNRVECPICHGEGKVEEEEKIRVEDRMKSTKASKVKTGKKYDESRGLQTEELDTPLNDPIAEKDRLKKITENADAKLLDEMYGGKADDAYISDVEKALKLITLNNITDYQQLAYKLGQIMTEIGNTTNIIEFLQCSIRQCGGKLTSDDFQKLSSTCNVMKEERKREEKAVTKKGKKKGKVNTSVVMSNDNWQDRMNDEDGGDDDDDFM